MRIRSTICTCAAVAVTVLPALGATLQFHADLDGLQEVGPNASPAFGALDLTLNDVTGAVTVTTGTFQDLLGGSTAVHIHGLAGPGVNAAVLIPLTLDTPGAATGTFSGNGVLSAANVAGMIAGNTYVNVHSQVFPGGEIRGQIFSVPEPASLVLLSLSGAILLRRGRKLT